MRFAVNYIDELIKWLINTIAGRAMSCEALLFSHEQRTTKKQGQCSETKATKWKAPFSLLYSDFDFCWWPDS